MGELLAPHGVHPGQDLLLIAVWDSPGQRQSTLADALAVEPPTVTRMVQRLERSGLVARKPDPRDARAQLVYPTARSRLLEATVRRAWATLHAELRQALGDGATRELERLADQASRALGATARVRRAQGL